MKKPLLLLLMMCSLFVKNAMSQTATTVSLNGTSSTNTISNNVTTVVDPGLTISSDGTISGFTVQITGSYTSGDILAYSGSLPSGISAGAFNTTSKSIQFTGITDAASWQTFLRTVTIRTSSATCYPEQRQVSFIAGAKFYNPLNGHFYQLSPTQTTWQTGYTNANNSSYFGRQGYMVTITSAAENSFVSKILASDSWIGNTDDYSYINSVLGTTTYANQSASEGKWYWASGPEKGTQTSTANQVNISGVYNSWNGGEPNNAGNENFGEIYVASGNWNDLNGSQGYYTIVEYGGMSTDNTSAQVVYTRNLAITGAPSGTITGGNVTVCSGTNSTTLTLSGLASGGSVARWEYSYDNFLSTQNTIANTTTTLTVNNITQNTYYRAVVNTSSCSGLGTSSTYINVSAAVAGNIVADNNTICNGANVNFTLNGYSGSIVKWQVSTVSNFSSNVTDISNTTPAMSYQLNTAGTYYFRAVVLSCSNTVYTNVYTISAIAGTAPVGGSVSSANFCGGSNSGTLTLSGYTGFVSKWQYSTDGGVVWTDVSNTTASLSYSAITGTRRYRAVLTNGACGTALSTPGIITIYSASVAGTASGAASVCAGTNSTTVSLSGNTGTIQWQSSANNSTFTDIVGATSSSYTATNLSATTYYRAVVTNGACTAANSSSVTVTVKQTSTSTTNTTICSSALPYTWNGLTFNASGSQTKHFTNSVGCDSAATLNLTVNATSTSTTDISICSSALPYSWNGLTLNASGTSTVHLTNAAGCDSAATLNLTVLTSTTSTTDSTVCPSALPFSWNGLTFNAAGTQVAHLTNSDGCDSLATLNLTVLSTSSTNLSICPSELPYSWNGLTFNAAGSQTAYITIGNGCDSLATLNLSLLANSTSTSIVSICPTALPYTWNGLTFNTAGTQTAHFTNTVGCDSAATLGLIVLATSTSTTNTSICPSALPYSWNGLTFNAAGSQTAHFTNSNGCDSAATLNLTVKANTTSTTNTSICPTALPYSWNGLTFNASGSQTAHFTNAAGCDSAATLNLTVKATSTSTTTVSVPFGGSYTFNGTTYTTAGTYTAHLTNSVGCDSAATLVFSIDPKPNAGADHSFACGSIPATDTISGSLPTTGTWTSLAGNPASAILSTTTNGVAVVTLPTAPFVGTIGFVYTTGGGKDTMLINITAPAAPVIEIHSGTTTICRGGSVMLCPSTWGWSNYQWYKNGVAVAPAVGTSACITLDSTQTGSYTLTATNGAGCWSSPSTATVVTYNSACSALPGACLAGTTSPCLSTSYVCLGTNTTFDLTTITLTCTKPVGTVLEWHTGNPATAANKVSNATAAPYGAYWAVYYDAANNCYGNNGFATQNVTVDTCSSNVTSGVIGGLESKTLGSVLAEKLYGNAKASKVETDGITNGVKFTNSGVVTNGTQNLTLAKLIPTTVIGTDVPYISTPTDLINLTNAVEVLAVDYSKNNTVKAVAFGTKTLGDVYSHTKPICDRLKGATLQEVKTINVNGYNVMAYKVQQCTGEIEYAINLSAGTATNRNSISLQSNWFTDDYQQDENLYNFQLWAVSYDMAKSMATDIITKLQANGTLNAVTATDLPKAFITTGNRKAGTVNLTITNNTIATSGYFEIKERATETGVETTRQIPVTMQPLSNSTVQLDVKDAYEATINLYIDNKKVDNVYLNDGTWATDYNKATTTLNSFKVINEGVVVDNKDEYRMLRNVNFNAITKDYVSVYKTIGTKCSALDINKYNSIKFNAKATGASSITVTLISSNITNWNEQYSYTINLDGDKEYAINLNQFLSSKFGKGIKDNSITGVSFSFNNSRGVQSNMVASLSNARFSIGSAAIVDENSITLGVYPNPNKGNFNVNFNSNTNQNLVLKVIEVGTGKTVKTIFVTATKGLNKQAVSLNNSTTSGNYIVTLEGDDIKYTPVKLMTGK